MIEKFLVGMVAIGGIGLLAITISVLSETLKD